jgi:NTE family protein
LALGSGGARGLAHIGVIKVFEKAGFKISYIAGSSMGALIGGIYAATLDISKLENLVLEIVRKYSISRFYLPRKENVIFKNQEEVERIFFNEVKGLKIEDLKIPFRAVATDLKTGESVILEKGDLVSAIKASSAIPFIFKPVEINGKTLVDGGFTNPVPVDVVKELGSEFVVAVDVSNFWPNFEDQKLKLNNLKSLGKDLIRAFEYQISKEKIKLADLVINPPVKNYTWNDFSFAKEIINKGSNEAERYVFEIRKKTNFPKPKKKPFLAFIDFITGTDY